MTSVHARKSVLELTEEDIRSFPLWEYALDEEEREGQDETFVRPVMLLEDAIPRIDRFELFVVATDYTTPAGAEYIGTVDLTIDQRRRVKLFSFVLVGDFGRELLPEASRAVAKKKGLDDALQRREEVCRVLETEERRLFPLQYRLRLPVAGEQKPRSGKVY
jgi:hypothetical protein